MVNTNLGKSYEYITGFKDNDKLRASFNDLTEKTYGFNFVDYYENGFWGDKYIPCSIMDSGRIVANVSVNLMDFYVDGVKKRYIQLGTVMTDREYRCQGLSRYIIERVISEYKDKCEAMYLFANDKVTDFYPKFGFERAEEYCCSRNVDFTGKSRTIEKVNMENKEDREKLLDTAEKIFPNDYLTMDNYGLYGFYLTGVMKDMVYYCTSQEAYAVAEIKDNTLFFHQVIADHKVDMERVIESFGEGIHKVVLGFPPIYDEGYEKKLYIPEDTSLFILGDGLDIIERKKLMFPILSHA